MKQHQVEQDDDHEKEKHETTSSHNIIAQNHQTTSSHSIVAQHHHTTTTSHHNNNIRNHTISSSTEFTQHHQTSCNIRHQTTKHETTPTRCGNMKHNTAQIEQDTSHCQWETHTNLETPELKSAPSRPRDNSWEATSTGGQEGSLIPWLAWGEKGVLVSYFSLLQITRVHGTGIPREEEGGNSMGTNVMEVHVLDSRTAERKDDFSASVIGETDGSVIQTVSGNKKRGGNTHFFLTPLIMPCPRLHPWKWWKFLAQVQTRRVP